jgi:hypothetical protein
MELARRETPVSHIALMSDGHLLRNDGSGWKKWKRVKPGVDIQGFAERFRAATEAAPEASRRYLEALMAATKLEHRGQLHSAIRLMGADAFRVHAEVNEFVHIADYAAIEEACRCYRQTAETAAAAEVVA